MTISLKIIFKELDPDNVAETQRRIAKVMACHRSFERSPLGTVSDAYVKLTEVTDGLREQFGQEDIVFREKIMETQKDCGCYMCRTGVALHECKADILASDVCFGLHLTNDNRVFMWTNPHGIWHNYELGPGLPHKEGASHTWNASEEKSVCSSIHRRDSLDLQCILDDAHQAAHDDGIAASLTAAIDSASEYFDVELVDGDSKNAVSNIKESMFHMRVGHLLGGGFMMFADEGKVATSGYVDPSGEYFPRMCVGEWGRQVLREYKEMDSDCWIVHITCNVKEKENGNG